MSQPYSKKVVGYITVGLLTFTVALGSQMQQASAAPAPAPTTALTPAPAPTAAVRFGFQNITGNSAVNAATGQNQLFLDVSQVTKSDQVLFTFNNIGSNASSITQIYFDQTTNLLKNIASITDSGDGVDFVIPKKIGTLPGSNNAP